MHVILRRVDDLWCDPLELREDSALGVAGLVAAVRAGTVTVANALGSGILETGALLGYLPRLCEHLLGSKLRMPSVATWWCGEPAACEYALKHLRELVIKPAYPTLGSGPVFCGDLPATELEALAARIALRPFDFVAQEMVNISQAPVLAGAGGKMAFGRESRALVARNIGLRVFAAASADGFRVLPGGLVRVASEADMRIVSMQHGGGSKDAWVLGSPARPRPLPRIVPGQLAPFAGGARGLGLSSRVAENFFWLGRYSERADAADDEQRADGNRNHQKDSGGDGDCLHGRTFLALAQKRRPARCLRRLSRKKTPRNRRSIPGRKFKTRTTSGSGRCTKPPAPGQALELRGPP